MNINDKEAKLLISKIECYKQMNLKWNIESIIFINNAGHILSDIFDKENIEALICIITAGTENKDSIEVKKQLSKYVTLFSEIDSLRLFIYKDLENEHKFIKTKEEDTEPINPLLLKNEKEEKKPEIPREQLLENEKDYIDYCIKIYLRAGYKIHEIYKMDLSDFDIIQNFVLEEAEREQNNKFNAMHYLGYLVAIAFNNPKKYPDKPMTVRLRPLSKKEQIEKIRKQTQQFFAEVEQDIKK